MNPSTNSIQEFRIIPVFNSQLKNWMYAFQILTKNKSTPSILSDFVKAMGVKCNRSFMTRKISRQPSDGHGAPLIRQVTEWR